MRKNPGENRFGDEIRRAREERGISLRTLAKTLGVSATYLSIIERGKSTPLTESRIRVLAPLIGCDVDRLLALSGRVSEEIRQIVTRHPDEMIALIRAAGDLPKEDVAGIARLAESLWLREKVDGPAA